MEDCPGNRTLMSGVSDSLGHVALGLPKDPKSFPSTRLRARKSVRGIEFKLKSEWKDTSLWVCDRKLTPSSHPDLPPPIGAGTWHALPVAPICSQERGPPIPGALKPLTMPWDWPRATGCAASGPACPAASRPSSSATAPPAILPRRGRRIPTRRSLPGRARRTPSGPRREWAGVCRRPGS